MKILLNHRRRASGLVRGHLGFAGDQRPAGKGEYRWVSLARVARLRQFGLRSLPGAAELAVLKDFP